MIATKRTATGQGAKQPVGAVSGVVRDSNTRAPLAGAIVRLSRADSLVAVVTADAVGRYTVRSRILGVHQLTVTLVGYRPVTRRLIIEGDVEVNVSLVASSAYQLTGVRITAATPVAVDVRTGDQSFQQRGAHVAPTATTSQILQTAIAGAARAPTSEVHIRGQHGEYTYYVDGVPVPSGISGSLNELFDPAVVDRIDFQTGGWDAEYGNKNIAVVKVATRTPAEGFHAELSAYAGSYASNGQALVASSGNGRLGILVSASRQETAMRREPVMHVPATGTSLNFHNEGRDEFAFAKAQYTASNRDRITVELSASRTNLSVPFDSSGGARLDDRQHDTNGFANVGWLHRFDASADSAERRELFAGIYLRQGGLRYIPGPSDIPQFLFFPDTTRRYTVREDRAASTTGMKVDYSLPVTAHVAFKTGIDASLVTGREAFQTRDSLDRPGPSVDSRLRGGDVGAYAQTVIAPSAQWQVRTGMRLDHHVAPLAGDAHQLSPRIRLVYFPDASTSVSLYYGRLFVPSNVEDFHVLATAAGGGVVGLPTIPERDHYMEADVVRRFAPGIVAKLAGYYRDNGPAVDDNTLPGTAVTTTVNVARVRVAGVESVIQLHSGGELAGYINAALSHASAHGPVTGGFFPTAYPEGWFDQDHDQRLSILASGEYTPRWGYASLTSVFGSGLTNGHPEAAANETGLFDFNPRIKVAPSLIWNASVGTYWLVGSTTLRTSVFVDNVFDHQYVLKGAFTSGPSIGRPRTVQIKVNVGGP